jgi:hypothetical protein
MKFSVLLMAVVLPACSSVQKKSEPAPAAAAAPAAKPAVPAKVLKETKPVAGAPALACEQGTDKRTVLIESKDGGCEVHYSKFGNSEKIAYSAHSQEYCVEVKEKIRSRLEAAQFTCK